MEQVKGTGWGQVYRRYDTEPHTGMEELNHAPSHGSRDREKCGQANRGQRAEKADKETWRIHAGWKQVIPSGMTLNSAVGGALSPSDGFMIEF